MDENKYTNKQLSRLINDWDAYLILFMSYLYAILLMLMPSIYDLDYIDVGTRLFFPRTTAVFIIIACTIKILGRIFNIVHLRYVGLILLNIVWFYVMLCLIWRLLHGMPSLGFLLGLNLWLAGLGQALRGGYKNK